MYEGVGVSVVASEDVRVDRAGSGAAVGKPTNNKGMGYFNVPRNRGVSAENDEMWMTGMRSIYSERESRGIDGNPAWLIR